MYEYCPFCLDENITVHTVYANFTHDEPVVDAGELATTRQASYDRLNRDYEQMQYEFHLMVLNREEEEYRREIGRLRRDVTWLREQALLEFESVNSRLEADQAQFGAQLAELTRDMSLLGSQNTDLLGDNARLLESSRQQQELETELHDVRCQNQYLEHEQKVVKLRYIESQRRRNQTSYADNKFTIWHMKC